MVDYSLISSTDLVNWEDHGIPFDARSASWGPRGAWAQQVLGPVSLANGTEAYVMYWPNIFEHSSQPTCGYGPTGCGVGIAMSTNGPTGPFVDVTRNASTVGPFMPGDDPTVMRDPDDAANATYLCSNPAETGPLCGKLGADLMSWDVQPQILNGFPHFFEAPWMSKVNGTWFISYMCPSRNETNATGWPAGHYGKDICISACDPSNSTVPCPLGNYTFMGSQLQWNPPGDCDTPYGCGAGGGENAHHGLFQFGPGNSQWYLAYHTRELAAQRGLASAALQRNIGMDAAYLDDAASAAAGVPVFWPVTATPNWMRQLAWVDPYSAQPGTLMSAASDGVSSMATQADSAGVGRAALFPAGQVSWLRVTGVDFGSAAKSLQLQVTVSTTAGGAGLAIAVGGPQANPAVSCPLPDTKGLFKTVTCTVPGPSMGQLVGVQDVYIVVDTAAVYGAPAVQLQSWSFVGGQASGSAPPSVTVPCSGIQAKANGRYLTAGANGAAPVTASSPSFSANTAVQLVDNEDGTYAVLMAGVAGSDEATYLCVDLQNPSGSVTAAATAPNQACARFSCRAPLTIATPSRWPVPPLASGRS